MRVFIAGATGAIGRRVVPLLVAGGHEVIGVARSPEKCAQLERQGAKAAEIDLFDPGAVKEAVQGAEAIVNLATAVPRGFRVFLPLAWRPTDRVRRQISANLVSAALAGGTVMRFVQESFAPLYADAGDAWVDESAASARRDFSRAGPVGSRDPWGTRSDVRSGSPTASSGRRAAGRPAIGPRSTASPPSSRPLPCQARTLHRPACPRGDRRYGARRSRISLARIG